MKLPRKFGTTVEQAIGGTTTERKALRTGRVKQELEPIPNNTRPVVGPESDLTRTTTKQKLQRSRSIVTKSLDAGPCNRCRKRWVWPLAHFILICLPIAGVYFVPWKHLAQSEGRPEVNEPMSAFVGVSTLVYALIYANVYFDSQKRMDDIRLSLTSEASSVQTAMLLVRQMKASDEQHKKSSLQIFSAYIKELHAAITTGDKKQMTNDPTSSLEYLYATVHYISQIATDDADDASTKFDAMDRVLCGKTIGMLNHIVQARNLRYSAMHNQQSWIQFVFLFQLALTSLVGASALEYGTEPLNRMAPAFVAATLLSSLYFLADSETPFTGFMRVDTSIFQIICVDIDDLLHKMERPAEELVRTGRHRPRSASQIQHDKVLKWAKGVNEDWAEKKELRHNAVP